MVEPAISGAPGLMSRFEKIGVIGAGSWGTALALLLHENGRQLRVWGHDPEHIEQVNATGENTVYLPGVPVPREVRFTNVLEELRQSDAVLVVTPSKAVREVVARLAAVALREDAVLVSCTKGVERGSGLRMSEILGEVFPNKRCAVLSGPSHAEEVARKMPTAVVLGCVDGRVRAALQEILSTHFFRVYTSDDVAGIELGGALKNIFALAAGVCDGLGLGDNSKAALVTRSLAELIRLGRALGGQPETFQGLSGIGDLIVTCYSRHSRNRLVGERLGRGEKLGAITASMRMVAEGVPTTYSADECAQRLCVETPIIEQMRALLDGSVSAGDVLTNLLSRDAKSELPGLQ